MLLRKGITSAEDLRRPCVRAVGCRQQLLSQVGILFALVLAAAVPARTPRRYRLGPSPQCSPTYTGSIQPPPGARATATRQAR